MKRYRSCSLLVCAGLALGSLGGCGKEAQSAETVKSPYAGAVSMEETPIVDYAVPQLLPNILTDRRGYSVGDVKEAAVKGSCLPGEFRLVDAATGEIVYSGFLSGYTYDKELDLYIGYADFSQVEEEGTYYLECDIVGRSYRFDIRKQLYGQLFEEVYSQLAEECEKKELTVSEAVALLETYEWYSVLFGDEDGSGTPDVLEKLKKWVSYMEEKGTDAGQEALYAAFLAKFGYNYQKFDLQYATDCLKRASTVYGQAQTTLNKDADRFFALTELYRATNLSTYRNRILDYTGFFENNSSYPEEVEYLYGSMTYLMTRQKVDMSLCETLMNNIMDRGEEISKRYEDMVHPVTAKNNGSADLLKRAVELSCANYVLNNYQYTNIIEDFLHYLMGRNVESVSFFETDEDSCSYLLLLAQLAANHLSADRTEDMQTK